MSYCCSSSEFAMENGMFAGFKYEAKQQIWRNSESFDDERLGFLLRNHQKLGFRSSIM